MSEKSHDQVSEKDLQILSLIDELEKIKELSIENLNRSVENVLSWINTIAVAEFLEDISLANPDIGQHYDLESIREDIEGHRVSLEEEVERAIESKKSIIASEWHGENATNQLLYEGDM